MRKTWTLGATGAALAAMFTVGGCYDFDEAEQRCRDELRCDPGGVGPPDGGDGGDDGGTDGGQDAGCTPVPNVVDVPDDLSADTDCDGVDGQADAGLFVDPTSGSDTQGTGTREAPLATLGRAIELLRAADGGGPTRVYLAGGPYNETTRLELNVPASLHGGYAGRGGGWQRPRTELAQLNGGSVGFTVRDVTTDAGIVLEYVHIRSANGTAPSEPSIALRVLRSSGVELRHAVLEAGLGAPGADGGSGMKGQDGPDGGNGGEATGSNPGNFTEITSISCSGSDRSGGTGGAGVVRASGLGGATGQPDAGGGDGGASNNLPVNDPDTGNRICNGGRGNPGLPGIFGDEGASGSSGSGTGTLDLMSGTWRPNQQGGGGDAGTPGEGGGGGGSGGTCTFGLTFTPGASGAGGSGGGGGCGGTGGQGGGGGGASIALLLIDSQVTADEGTQLRTLGGGPGGSGGGGGEGGKGGEGGDGGAGGFVQGGGTGGFTYQTNGGRGGVGGRGGNGGNGGAGGGGGGGPSVGVWCSDAGVVLADSGVTFTVGDGGTGGASPANRGDDGVKENVIGCQPIQ